MSLRGLRAAGCTAGSVGTRGDSTYSLQALGEPESSLSRVHDESVLLQEVGGALVMSEQLCGLLKLTRAGRVGARGDTR